MYHSCEWAAVNLSGSPHEATVSCVNVHRRQVLHVAGRDQLLDPVILGVRMPPRELKGKQKAEPDADVEDEAPAAKKTKPEKVKKKPMRRPDHGKRAARPSCPAAAPVTEAPFS